MALREVYFLARLRGRDSQGLAPRGEGLAPDVRMPTVFVSCRGKHEGGCGKGVVIHFHPEAAVDDKVFFRFVCKGF